MSTSEKLVTPQDALMTCLEDADRISSIVICAVTKDGFREFWSNDLEDFERLGLLRMAMVRIEKRMADAVEE